MYNSKSHKRRIGRLYEVIECTNKGMSKDEIAEELGVTKRTINKYLQYIRNIQEK